MYEQVSVAKLNRIFRRKKPEAKVIVGGCMPAIDPTRLQEIGELTLIDPRSMERIRCIDFAFYPDDSNSRSSYYGI